MVKESTPGQMVGNMMENMSMIKNVGEGSSTGQMEGNMTVVGRMADNMVMQYSQQHPEIQKKDFGKMGKELVGKPMKLIEFI